MEKLVQTAFRLYEHELTQLDALVESPPQWLRTLYPTKVKDRTDVIRRLIFMAGQKADFGEMPGSRQVDMNAKPKAKKKAKN